jgi:tetratricopeptide (TPR) repeat protein
LPRRAGRGGLRTRTANPETHSGLCPQRGPLAPEVGDGLVIGHRLMEAGEFELALDFYTRALARRGIDADVLSAMGSANLRLGRLNQAETLLRKGNERDPTHVAAWNNLGVVPSPRAVAGGARRVPLAFAQSAGLRR